MSVEDGVSARVLRRDGGRDEDDGGEERWRWGRRTSCGSGRP